ncbi:MAG: hypothetical protein OMM_07860 [Candidatus Magnetoglobus multicellularis str. Araruama]|uniref:Twitching motility protein n=1 Tax=Candidatus Magnetoglobus multicellularis str. Araruama TaxID=890399 RepID=A0A1V1PAM0_9BACT|nr:MAG: hypothetical protein OMM_07860 [Candidatus Magnetoglobus multicellularis str. Araruama]
MRKQEIDQILSQMLYAFDNVSDLNITVGKPFQVENSGQLVKVPLKPAISTITPFQSERLALNLINGDRRLTETLIKEGSCDLSYELDSGERFRVNIFSQSGNYSIVLRKLATDIPTIEQLNLPEAFGKMALEKMALFS